jgi:phage tail-like protein
MSREQELAPLHVFHFQVDFEEDPLTGEGGGAVALCSGAFAECTGLEATMDVKVIKEGGRNYGPAQRVGPVTFATVVLKRGMTTTRHAWKWFELLTSGGGYASRLAATITMFDLAGAGVLAWKLEKAMPVKFKAADLNAKSPDLAIEELHLAHEGLSLVAPKAKVS